MTRVFGTMLPFLLIACHTPTGHAVDPADQFTWRNLTKASFSGVQMPNLTSVRVALLSLTQSSNIVALAGHVSRSFWITIP